MAQILLKRKGIGDLIQIVDQGVDSQRRGRGGSSPEPGVAHATGHQFYEA
jgi:hypothetical protein